MQRTANKKKSAGTKKKSTEAKKGPALHEQAKATLKKMQAKDPGLKGLLEKAYGYVVFPSVGKASLVVGGAFGRGIVFERQKPVGYATVGQLTIGVQLGGDTFSELIIFDSREPFQRFKRGRMAFAANASAVLVKAGAAASSNFEKGAAVFVHSDGGMMLELALGGQKFKFSPTDESGSQAGSSAGGKGAVASGSRSSDEGEDESGEGEEAGTSGAVTGFIREHPVWALLVGAGLATGAVIASRYLRSSWQDESDDQDEEGAESNEGEEDEDGPQARDRQEDDDEGDEDENDDRQSGGRGESEEGEEDTDEDEDESDDEDEAAAEDEDEEEQERGESRTSSRKKARSRWW